MKIYCTKIPIYCTKQQVYCILLHKDCINLLHELHDRKKVVQCLNVMSLNNLQRFTARLHDFSNIFLFSASHITTRQQCKQIKKNKHINQGKNQRKTPQKTPHIYTCKHPSIYTHINHYQNSLHYQYFK